MIRTPVKITLRVFTPHHKKSVQTFLIKKELTQFQFWIDFVWIPYIKKDFPNFIIQHNFTIVDIPEVFPRI